MNIAGEEYGRIRNMFDETKTTIKSASPSQPAVVLGLSKTTSDVDDYLVVKN
jgi:translation initiation factor IF-2